MITIFYRFLISDDYGEYLRMRLEGLRKHPDSFGSTYEEESRLDALKLHYAIKGSRTGQFVLGAFVEDQLVGICGFVRDVRKKAKHRGELVQLYVDENFSMQGIGESLLTQAIDKAFENPDIEQITLGVVSSNHFAVGLYHKP